MLQSRILQHVTGILWWTVCLNQTPFSRLHEKVKVFRSIPIEFGNNLIYCLSALIKRYRIDLDLVRSSIRAANIFSLKRGKYLFKRLKLLWTEWESNPSIASMANALSIRPTVDQWFFIFLDVTFFSADFGFAKPSG